MTSKPSRWWYIADVALVIALAITVTILTRPHHHGLVATVKLPQSGLAVGSPLTSIPYKETGRVITYYTSGVQIGNYVLLYQATHRRSYLDNAIKLAETGFRVFGALAYQVPPGNSEPFGAIYLRELKTLVPYSKQVGILYNTQRTAYVKFVKTHEAKGGSAHQWPSGLWSDKQQHYAFVWPFAMLVAADESKQSFHTADAMRFYWDSRYHGWRSSLTTGAKPSGDLYYDDNAWVEMDMQTAYRATHRSMYFHYLRQDFDFLRSGWTKYGGVLWVKASWSKSITSISTLGLEQAALDLYLDTPKVHNHLRYNYLAWASWAQSWLDRNMKRSDGILYDHKTICGPPPKGLCWVVPTKPGPPANSFSDPLFYISIQAI